MPNRIATGHDVLGFWHPATSPPTTHTQPLTAQKNLPPPKQQTQILVGLRSCRGAWGSLPFCTGSWDLPCWIHNDFKNNQRALAVKDWNCLARKEKLSVWLPTALHVFAVAEHQTFAKGIDFHKPMHLACACKYLCLLLSAFTSQFRRWENYSISKHHLINCENILETGHRRGN